MRRRLLRIATVIAGGLMLAVALLVADGLRDHLGHADVALVLGSKVELDGTPSARLRARLDRTAELYRGGYFPRVIASGGMGKEGYDEAKVMRDYLAAHGVPAERIIVDSSGVTTMASAVATREIAGREKWQSVLVVSQYFHLPRSRLALQKVGFSEIYTAHARHFEVRDLYSVPREVVGWVRYAFSASKPNNGS